MPVTLVGRVGEGRCEGGERAREQRLMALRAPACEGLGANLNNTLFQQVVVELDSEL